MALTGKKRMETPVRPMMEDWDAEANDPEDKKDLSGSEELLKEGMPLVTDKPEEERSPAEEIDEDVRNDVQNMLDQIEADIKKVFDAKRRRFEMNTNASVKKNNRKLEFVWKTQQEQWQKIVHEYSQAYLALYQQCNTEKKKAKEQGMKLAIMFQHQQRLLQQTRYFQSQTLNEIKILNEEFMKDIKDIQKNCATGLADAQNELIQELVSLQRKLLMDTEKQEMLLFKTLFGPC